MPSKWRGMKSRTLCMKTAMDNRQVFVVQQTINLYGSSTVVPRLYVTGVPLGVHAPEVQEALTRAGLDGQFTEFGQQPWANHSVEELGQADPKAQMDWLSWHGERVSWDLLPSGSQNKY